MGPAGFGSEALYLGRWLVFNRPNSQDHRRLPQRPLRPSPTPCELPSHRPPADLATLPVAPRAGAPAQALAGLLASTGTTSLVVLHRGRVVWEHHANGGARDLPQRCFSVTKSVASALLGLAVADGHIGSLDTPVGRWLPELHEAGVAGLSLSHLMRMHSGIRFSEGLLPWCDAPRTYYGADLRQRLARLRIRDDIGAFFHYNDWHPLLLALVLERATGRTVTEWLQQRLWNPLGAEHRASMMVDRDDDSGLEHLESGLTATALDLAKFGQLYLQDGVWNGRPLLPPGWVRATTSPEGARTDAAWFAHYRKKPWGRFLSSGRVYYQGLWWGTRLDERRHDFFAMGVLGQHVHVSPDTQTVIVRLSNRFPPGLWWAGIFRHIAEAVHSAA